MEVSVDGHKTWIDVYITSVCTNRTAMTTVREATVSHLQLVDGRRQAT